MILRCLVTTVTRNRKGQPIRLSKTVSGDPIKLGRSAECTIHLPDSRVHLHHAIIRFSDLGKLYIEGRDAPIEVNGESVNRTKLRRGVRILIGPYQVTPEPALDEDHDFGLAIELVQAVPEDAADLKERSRTLLGETWLSKRALAWALFLLVGATALGLPLAYARAALSRGDGATPTPVGSVGVAWDAVWSPGPLSSGHQSLTNRCSACHTVAFESVQDAACVKCHTPAQTGAHARDPVYQVAVTTGARCSECHRDHQGDGVFPRVDGTLCVNCHADLSRRFPSSKLPRITDFATDHPDLSPTIGGVAVPASPAEAGREPSGLKFSHQAHLVVGLRSPSGRRTLTCAQCHRPDVRRGFEPIRMTEHCSECHGLEFEPAVTSRRAPHGKPEDVLTMLREFYSQVALRGSGLDVTVVDGSLRRPAGEAPSAQSQRARAWAEEKAARVAKDMIETRVCGQCHSVSRGPAPLTWVVQPVKLNRSWLQDSDFDHRSHQQAECARCHAVAGSRSSDDLSLPGIATCRSCHAGAIAVTGKVRSPCEKCHSFHQHTTVAADSRSLLSAPSTSAKPAR
jgi:hypothetical protein